MAVNGKVESIIKDDDARIPCYFGFTNQKQWKQYIQGLLKKNDNAVKRGVIQIYNRQTFDEQVEQESSEVNGIGFSKHDAPFLSTVAIALISGKQIDKKTFEITRNKMMHYWKQLMNISKAGLEERLKQIKLRLIEEDLDKEEGEKDVGNNTNDKCVDNSNSGGNIGEGTQMYLFPELFGEAEENPASNSPSDSRCSNNAGSNNSES